MKGIECERRSSGQAALWPGMAVAALLAVTLMVCAGCVCPLRPAPTQTVVTEPAPPPEVAQMPEATEAPGAAPGDTAADIVNVTTADFAATVLEASMPVVVDFWAPWCGPCKLMDPILANLNQQFAGRAIVAKVNVDDEPELAQRYSIRAIPAVFVFSKGEPVSNWEGISDGLEQQIADAISESLGQ